MKVDSKRAFAVEVVQRLKQAGFQALWAGGCVRDFLLGRAPEDYDVATDALPDQVRDLFGHRRTLTVGASFGVIIVIGTKKAGNVEVATFRTEGPYLDGRRPEHVSFSSPEEDAQRRDFTINGMFYDPVEQKIFDYVGGEQDLGAGIVRAIGNPHDRMQEDKLRMLRAVRFSATLEFELDIATADAVRKMANEITVVSIERITQELRRMLVSEHRHRAIELTHEVGLLKVILPELDLPSDSKIDDNKTREWEITLHMLQHLQEPDIELAAATLLHHVVRPDTATRESSTQTGPSFRVEEAAIVRAICKRLKMSNKETDHIAWLVGHQYELLDAQNLPLSKLKRLLANPLSTDLLKLARVEALATNTDLTPIVFSEEYLHATPAEELNPPPLLTGDDLIAEGFHPGPHFKNWLETVRDAQLDDEIGTKQEAVKLIEQIKQSTDG